METRDLVRQPLMPDAWRQIAAVVIDPQKDAGAGRGGRVTDRGTKLHTTFTRDAPDRVGSGNGMDPVLGVDQVRRSPHVEFAAAFRRK